MSTSSNIWFWTVGRLLVATCVLCALIAKAEAANPWIDMGLKDDLAFDQPVVTFELFEQLSGGGKGASLGPSDGGFFLINNQFILDTGASSTLAMNDAESELRDNGYVTVNTVIDQGVAGSAELDVSAEYYLEVTDSGGVVRALPFTRITSGQFPDLFGINGVVGMPGLVGRVLTLDTSVWEGVVDIFDLVPMDVHIASSLPTGGGHRYSVPIRARTFNVEGEPPLPTAAPIPFLDMSVGFGDLNATGSFVVDTGAVISFISTQMGIAIGLDSNHDGVLDSSDEQSDGTLPLGGIGGFIEAPLFYIDRFTVPTEQGVDLVWNLEQSLSVLIVDIDPEIDGVLGSDLLTSGWLSLFGGGEESSPGPIQQVHFDFRQFFEDGDTGALYFDLTPSFDIVQSVTLSGDYNGDNTVDAADYTVWRDAVTAGLNALPNRDPSKMNGVDAVGEDDFFFWRNHFGETLTVGGLSGDYNGDNTVDAADYSVWRDAMTAGLDTLPNRDPSKMNGMDAVGEDDFIFWRNHFGDTLGGAGASSAAVPEPTSLALLLSLTAMAGVCRRSLGVATRPARCAASLRCASSWRK